MKPYSHFKRWLVPGAGALLALLLWQSVSVRPPAVVSQTIDKPETYAFESAPETAAVRVSSAGSLSPNSPLSSAQDAQHALTAFRDWSRTYLSSPEEQKKAMIPSGIELAKQHRQVMAQLIHTNPQQALAAAVPMTVRAGLPAVVVSLLEERISSRSLVALNTSCFHKDDGTPHDHEKDDHYRATVVGDKEYRVFVYGSRLNESTVEDSFLSGVAVDNLMALSDKPLRVLEKGEKAGSRKVVGSSGASADTPLNLASSPVAVEVNGEIRFVDNLSEADKLADALVAQEAAGFQRQADRQAGASGVGSRPKESWTHGDKKLLVILVDFIDVPGVPTTIIALPGGTGVANSVMTEDYISGLINYEYGVNNYFKEGSYGKSSIHLNPAVLGDSPDVTQVFRMPRTAAYYAIGNSQDTPRPLFPDAYNELLHKHARDAATNAGYPVYAYDRVCVAFSNLSTVPGSYITYGGLAQINGKNFWVNGEFDRRVVAHELGHTYGLYHANLWQVSDGNPISPVGQSLAYGDPFDLMGQGDYGFGYHFNQYGKTLLHWIPDTSVTLAEKDGIYRIFRFDHSRANLTRPLALKIIKDGAKDYWVGYRRAASNASVYKGAYVIWGYNQNNETDLIDINTPGGTTQTTDGADAGLPVGQTFVDQALGISIKPVAQGMLNSGVENEWLDLQVTFESRIEFAQAKYTVNEKLGSVTLTLNRLGKKTGIVTVKYSTTPGTAITPNDYTNVVKAGLTWADGDDAPKTITIPIVADSILENNEVFSVVLSDITGGILGTIPSALVTIADPGNHDTTYLPSFADGGDINRVIALPNGSVLIGGGFTSIANGTAIPTLLGGIARLTPSGAYDRSFDPGLGVDGIINTMEVQPDGKILIGGVFSTFNGTARSGIARLNADGSLDASFDPGAGFDDAVRKIVVLPNGNILVAGVFKNYNAVASSFLVRLLPNGTLDTTFVTPAITGGLGVYDLITQVDGKILIGGDFANVGGQVRSRVARISANGAVDTSFLPGAGASAEVDKLALQPDGKILIGGTFATYGGVARSCIARINSTGGLDTTFTPGTTTLLSVNGIIVLPDNKIMIAGSFNADTTESSHIAVLLSTGVLDANFVAPSDLGSFIKDISLQADGNVLIGGVYAPIANSIPQEFYQTTWRIVAGLPSNPGSFQLSSAAVTANEGTSLVLTVTRTGGSLGAATLAYATVADTADSTDFTPASGVLTWVTGDSASKSITIPIKTDHLNDVDETFKLNLGTPLVGSILGTVQQSIVTITTVPVQFTTWTTENFTTAEQANALISGPLVDPDKDGLNNILEFAFGLAPKVANSTGRPKTGVTTDGGVSYLSITFRRRILTNELTYTPQVKDALSGAWTAATVLVGTPTDNGDETETVTYRDTVGIDGSVARFMRILVTKNP